MIFFGNNVLIKEALEEVMEVLNNLNVEVLTVIRMYLILIILKRI